MDNTETAKAEAKAEHHTGGAVKTYRVVGVLELRYYVDVGDE